MCQIDAYNLLGNQFNKKKIPTTEDVYQINETNQLLQFILRYFSFSLQKKLNATFSLRAVVVYFFPTTISNVKNIVPSKWMHRLPSLSLCKGRTICFTNPRMKKPNLNLKKIRITFSVLFLLLLRKREQFSCECVKKRKTEIFGTGWICCCCCLLIFLLVFEKLSVLFAKSICENDFGSRRFQSKSTFFFVVTYLTVMRNVVGCCFCCCCCKMCL